MAESANKSRFKLGKWQKRLLVIFGLIAIVGIGLRASAIFTGEPEVQHRATDGAPGLADVEGRAFLQGSPRSADAEEQADADPGWLPGHARLGGWLIQLGVGFLAGLAIGVFFRTFIKTMALLAALAVVGAIGLAYFEVIDTDFTALRANYEQFTGWLGAQAGRLGGVPVELLPALLLAGGGFVVGFIRR